MKADRWLVRPQPIARPRLRLFCFPHAGGSPPIFNAWPNYLPANVEVTAVHLPGRGARFREPACRRLQPLLQALVGALEPQLDRPFALFGHSMGALVAFELARALQLRARLPHVLLVAAAPAPHLPLVGPPAHELPDTELVAHLQRLNGTPAELLENEEMLSLLLPSLRADLAVYETYHYQEAPPLACPIVAFGGQDDEHVDRAHLAAWKLHTTVGCAVQLFPGDHFFLSNARPALLQAIAREVE